MLAARGGLARQRKCRRLGINPTETATKARLARKRATVADELRGWVKLPRPSVKPLGRYRCR
jgi:hypothetical protein